MELAAVLAGGHVRGVEAALEGVRARPTRCEIIAFWRGWYQKSYMNCVAAGSLSQRPSDVEVAGVEDREAARRVAVGVAEHARS